MVNYSKDIKQVMQRLRDVDTHYVRYLFQAIADSPSRVLEYYLTDTEAVVTAFYPDVLGRFEQASLTELLKAGKIVYEIVLELYKRCDKDLFETLINLLTVRYLLYGLPVNVKRVNLEVPVRGNQN